MNDSLIKIEAKMEYLNTRVTETKQEICQLGQEVKSGFSEMRKKLNSTLKWVIGICLTSVFGVAAIVISAFG